MFQKGANLAAMLAVSRYNDPVYTSSNTSTGDAVLGIQSLIDLFRILYSVPK